MKKLCRDGGDQALFESDVLLLFPSFGFCAVKKDLKNQDGFAGPVKQRHSRLCASPLSALQE